MIIDYEDTIRAGDIFRPVMGTVPSGLVTTDSVGSSVASYTNPKSYSWTLGSSCFNVQGQKWEQNRSLQLLSGYDGLAFYPVNAGGQRQAGTPRCYSAPSVHLLNEHGSHITELEFVFTGTSFSIQFYNLGGNGSYDSSKQVYNYGGDLQVWVEFDNNMWRIADIPKTVLDTSGAASYRNITFASPYSGRIRIAFGATSFGAIVTEKSSIISPAPPRPFFILDGDSYTESTQALDADSTTGWFCLGIGAHIFERTGFTGAYRGQGATGFFTNGATLVTDDTIGTMSQDIFIFGTVSITGVSRTMSQSRVDWMTRAAQVQISENVKNLSGIALRPQFIVDGGEDFGQPLGRRPLFYILNGTWNDASVGGVTDAQMYARAKQCYQTINNLDKYCSIIHVSPEPFNDGMFNGATGTGIIGDPRPGDKSDIHRVAQMRAAKECSRVTYINAFGPDADTRWWSGYGPADDKHSGTQGVPTNSQQAQLVSVHDGIHGRREMYRYYANKICDQIAEVRLPLARVIGLV